MPVDAPPPHRSSTPASVLRGAVRGQLWPLLGSSLLVAGHELSEAAVPVVVGWHWTWPCPPATPPHSGSGWAPSRGSSRCSRPAATSVTGTRCGWTCGPGTGSGSTSPPGSSTPAAVPRGGPGSWSAPQARTPPGLAGLPRRRGGDRRRSRHRPAGAQGDRHGTHRRRPLPHRQPGRAARPALRRPGAGPLHRGDRHRHRPVPGGRGLARRATRPWTARSASASWSRRSGSPSS